MNNKDRTLEMVIGLDIHYNNQAISTMNKNDSIISRHLKPKFSFLLMTVNYFEKSDHCRMLLISDLLDWCNAWKINPSKSSFLTISFKKNQIPSTYFIGDNPITKVFSQRNL